MRAWGGMLMGVWMGALGFFFKEGGLIRGRYCCAMRVVDLQARYPSPYPSSVRQLATNTTKNLHKAEMALWNRHANR